MLRFNEQLPPLTEDGLPVEEDSASRFDISYWACDQ